jgi:hypothetical protein
VEPDQQEALEHVNDAMKELAQALEFRAAAAADKADVAKQQTSLQP